MAHAIVSKAPDALRTIGEVSADTGIATHILRYWERNVADLRPLRRAGRRYYRATDVALVQRLHALVAEQGYTLEGAARAVRGNDAPPSVQPQQPTAQPDLALLLRVRARLQAALDAN